jgi:hypothetical protein
MEYAKKYVKFPGIKTTMFEMKNLVDGLRMDQMLQKTEELECIAIETIDETQ